MCVHISECVCVCVCVCVSVGTIFDFCFNVCQKKILCLDVCTCVCTQRERENVHLVSVRVCGMIGGGCVREREREREISRLEPTEYIVETKVLCVWHTFNSPDHHIDSPLSTESP